VSDLAQPTKKSAAVTKAYSLQRSTPPPTTHPAHPLHSPSNHLPSFHHQHPQHSLLNQPSLQSAHPSCCKAPRLLCPTRIPAGFTYQSTTHHPSPLKPNTKPRLAFQFFFSSPLTSEHISINQPLSRLIASQSLPPSSTFYSSSSSFVSLVSDSLSTDGTRLCSHFLRATSHLPIIRPTVHNTKSLWTCDLARNQNTKTLPTTKLPRTSPPHSLRIILTL